MNKPETGTQRLLKWARNQLAGDQESDTAPDEDVCGHFFCLTNSFMPGLVYIGATVRPVKKTIKDLNKGLGGGTGLGEPEDYHLAKYELEWSEKVENLWALDDELRRKLDYFVDPEESTYFRCSPETARATLRTVIKQAGGNISR